MTKRVAFCLLISLVFGASAALSATVERGLEERLHAARADENISIIARLYSPRDMAALDQELHARRAPLAERHRLVIEALQANAAETQGPVIDRLDRWTAEGRVEGYTTYWIDNLIVVYGKASAILELATDPAIESIGPNFQVELIDRIGRGPIRGSYPSGRLDNEFTTPGQRAVGSTRVNRELGITGHGTLVANCDTGVDGDHPALASRWRGTHAPLAECWLDLLGGQPDPTDTYGHGTHVMGTICGREYRPGQNPDTITVGGAPDAEWIATNAINQGVSPQFDQDILDAYEWFADPDGNPNTFEDVPDVIQNSWGVFTGLGYPRCFTNWNAAIQNCEAAGPVITWSAGNESSSGLRSPAIFELTPVQIFSVGAVDATNDNTPPYQIAGFSSRGPSGCAPDPQAIKPEIAAPGVDVYSSVPGGGYQQDGWSGTSMAGPHVAGVVALMREACPDCDPQTIKEALRAAAVDSGYLPQGDDNTFGAGFLNAWDAVMAVFALGRVDGFVTTPAGDPVPGVRVQATDAPNFVNTNATGYYILAAQEGEHDIRFTKFGYQTVTVQDVQAVTGDTTRVDVTMSTVPAGTMVGTVIIQSGIGVQGARVIIRNTPLDTLVTDTAGHFTADLPATDYEVHVEYIVRLNPPQTFTVDTLLTVNAGPPTQVTVILFIPFVEPTNADAYGYRCYDRYDRDLPAPYQWVELDPLFGGSGTEFTYVNADSAVFLPTPFPIGFYGTDRDTLTVNCNGWMLPGVHTMPGQVNTAIPSNQGNDPPGIIAGFWDDLRRGLGAQQFHWLDAANGRWIFEFANQRLVTPSDRFHNWEVHFLDPAFYPTTTGDCEILMVYGVMEYIGGSTLGIERPDEQTGVQVWFNGSLNPASWPVERGAALRYTTGRATQLGNVTVQLSLYPPPGNINDVLIRMGGRTIVANGNGQFIQDSIPAAPVSALLSLSGYEAARLTRVAIQAGQMNNVPMAGWRLDPPRSLSASQFNGNITVRWRVPESVQTHANPDVRYVVYRNDVPVSAALADTFFVEGPFPNDSTLTYTVKAHYRFGVSPLSNPLTIQVDLPVSEVHSMLPKTFALYPNYPNPFNPQTSIRLDVPEVTVARLEIFDVSGRLVRTLWNGTMDAGRHTITWDSRDQRGDAVATGMYLCRFASDKFTATQKMLLVK